MEEKIVLMSVAGTMNVIRNKAAERLPVDSLRSTSYKHPMTN
jgi:hypothetical protein